MRMVRFVVAASVAVLAVSFASASAQTKDPAVDKLVADWAAAFARADAKTLASLYTENAIRVTPDGGRVVGREAISKEFATAFAGPQKGATIKIQVGAVQPVGADISVAEGTYEVIGTTGPDGKPAPPIKGSYLNTMVKKDGAWVLVPLPRDVNRDQAFAVDIVYAQTNSLAKSRWSQPLQLAAPRTDVPNTYAEWQLYVPATLQSAGE